MTIVETPESVSKYAAGRVMLFQPLRPLRLFLATLRLRSFEFSRRKEQQILTAKNAKNFREVREEI